MWKFVFGCMLSLITGVASALFGWFMMDVMTTLNTAPLEGKNALDESRTFILVMTFVSIGIFFTKSGVGFLLSEVSENIIKSVREELYQKIIRKDIGWHDQRDNAAGIMTSTLASDVQLLNGFASEGVAVQTEAMGSVLTALIGGFIFSWPMTLVGIGVAPIMLICTAL